MPGGRPTKYKPEFCEQVIELMHQGASIEEICHELFIAKPTFYEWCEKYPEFSNAKKIGESLSEGWWKKNGRTQLQNKDFNSSLWYMNMKNRFGWRDRQETDVTSGGEKISISPIQWTEGDKD